MAGNLTFGGKVAVITGAGGGLGKAYALLFAARGAKVVVNDLGGNPRGEGSDARMADLVVNKIRSSGGIAVADYNSVLNGAKIIETALENFGRIDILVNNAGILRDKSFARTSDDDWDAIHSVHLKGSFITTRAAFPHMKSQKYGKIIMTSSGAGIYGNFGQSNYSAAKLGLLGLSNTIAIEGRRYNVSCNTLVPTGATRLTEGILPPDLFDELKPELIAPLVVWLCHENCEESGGVFEASAGWFSQYRWERTKGAVCRSSLSETVSPEAVRDNWKKITDFSESENMSSIQEASGRLAMILEDLKENSKVSPSFTSAITDSAPSSSFAVEPSFTSAGNRASGPLTAVGATATTHFEYEPKTAILYALGLGVSVKDDKGLQFLYEGHESFAPLPTFVVIPAQMSLMGSSLLTDLHDWQIDLSKILHGEQYIELIKPLPASGKLTSKATITDVLDKGSGAVILNDVYTYDESGSLLAKSQFSTFVVGDGGFGGPRQSERLIPLVKPPIRHPDAVRSFTTSSDQAALYRLNGDFNPMHIDPSFAAMGGFDQPILHGLCSFGIAAKSVFDEYCEGDVTKFKAIKTRFSSPVIPGQTLVTSMWKDGDRVFFETHVKETAKICLSGGYVDLYPSSIHSGLLTPALFTTMGFKVRDNPIIVKKGLASTVSVWNILKNGKLIEEWTLDFHSEPCRIHPGLPRVNVIPAVTVTSADEVIADMLKGKLSPEKALKEAKLKFHGSFNVVSAVVDLFSPKSML